MKRYDRLIVLISLIIIVLLTIRTISAEHVKFSISVVPPALTIEIDTCQHAKGKGE
ncbi:hypothetical protein [Megamonas hypermegale]|uniref:hypothetical protein n=1 Tax=Megamonas hypermegale TaxID=158847 RepID=UPI00195D3DC9|nr:hypothetical protein [Megamonas hypermegale]MBM6761668.1 hypothetical protein [Megamonas hypermegale]